MNTEQSMLFRCSRGILGRNRIFKDRHRGECCYIFGNGVSLKWMDLAKFDDRVSIGCTYLWLHKDFDALDVRYYSTIAPFWFYPYWRHSISRKLVRNLHSSMQKRILKAHPNISFFTSLSNMFGVHGDNVYYLHHFGVRKPSADTFDMSGTFFFTDTINALISMAIYMGFESACLVGFDYTHSPQQCLHFYERGRGITQYDDDYNASFFNLARQYIDLTTITINGSMSKTLKYIDYRDYTGAAPVFRENTELVSKEYLDVMAKSDDYSIY